MAKINTDLTKLEFKQLDRSWIEHSLGLKEILRPVIPNSTLEIVRIQKQNKGRTTQGGQGKEANLNVSNLFQNRDNQQYISRCVQVDHFPFCILTKDERYELIANSYNSYRFITGAIAEIAKNPSLLTNLVGKLEQLNPEQEEE